MRTKIAVGYENVSRQSDGHNEIKIPLTNPNVSKDSLKIKRKERNSWK
jgi:hypothetical protein